MDMPSATPTRICARAGRLTWRGLRFFHMDSLSSRSVSKWTSTCLCLLSPVGCIDCSLDRCVAMGMHSAVDLQGPYRCARLRPGVKKQRTGALPPPHITLTIHVLPVWYPDPSRQTDSSHYSGLSGTLTMAPP